MSTFVFVLVFILLGLGVLLIAMSGGRGGIGAALHSQSRGSRKFATFGFVVLLLALGGGVPAAVIAAVKDRTDDPAASLSGLTPDEKRGQELFGQRCDLCHTLKASNAVASVGPDLDTLAPNYQLVLTTIKNGQSNGNGQMPAQIFTGKDAEDVAKYVAKAVGASGSSGG
jgi:cytochrome c551